MAPQEVNGSGGDGGVEGTAIVCLRGGKGDGKKEKKKMKKMKKEAKSHENDQLPINDDTKPTHGSGQDHPEVLRAAIQRQQVQLDTLLSGPTRDKSKATKLARKIVDATKSLEGLEHKRGMDYRNYPDQTGGVNKEEGKEEQQVEEPVTKKSKKSKKRKAAEIDEDKKEAGQQASEVTVAEVNTIQDTSKSEKKKRKKDKSLQDSNIRPSSIAAFADNETLESGRPITNGLPSALNAAHNPKTSQHNIDDAPADARTPQQVKMDALLATITSTRSPPASDDHRLDALIAGTVSAKSPAAICMDKLITVGQAALKAAVYPTRPPLEISESEAGPQNKPRVVLHPRKEIASRVTPKEPRPIVPAKNVTSDGHVRIETPIPLPQRKISTTTRITPGTKPTPAESSKLAGHQKSEEHAQSKDPSSQTAKALKEAASATVIGLSSQPDPFTSSIITDPPPKLPRAIPSPQKTPSKAQNRSRGKRVEAEGGEDWEVASGRVRARVNAEGTTDDQETEENIAFSSTYLSTRPLGISISGTKFQVLAISSGTEQELPMHASKESVKICSVAKGRVQVALGGKTFAIGEGGMWRVRAGEKCVVVNNNKSQLGSGQGVVANVHICTTDA